MPHDPECHAAKLKWHDPDCCDCDLIAKVRADERAKGLADLRAKVEVLRAENTGDAKSGNRLDRDFNLGKVYAYERVLALIDGNSE